MITLRSGSVRAHDRRAGQEAWRTFNSRDRADPLAHGFGALRSLEEEHLAPKASVLRHAPGDAEILTYVCEGSLAHEDALGRPGIIQAGEFHRMTARCGILPNEANASRTDQARVFRIVFGSSGGALDSGDEQKRFCAAERRGGLCIVGSRDGRGGSLRILPDAFVYSSLLDVGQHVVHELSPGRIAWLHLVSGEVTLNGVVLRAGDGAALTAERAVSLTACESSELLLVDLGDEPPWSPMNGDT